MIDKWDIHTKEKGHSLRFLYFHMNFEINQNMCRFFYHYVYICIAIGDLCLSQARTWIASVICRCSFFFWCSVNSGERWLFLLLILVELLKTSCTGIYSINIYLCNMYYELEPCWSPCHKVYSIQRHLIKLVLDLQQVGVFLWVLQFPTSIKLTATILL